MLTNAGREDKLRPGQEVWEEKVNQIRIYSGDKYELINEAQAGDGLCRDRPGTYSRPGEGWRGAGLRSAVAGACPDLSG